MYIDKSELEDVVKKYLLTKFKGIKEDNWTVFDVDVKFTNEYIQGQEEYDEGYDVPTYTIRVMLESFNKKGVRKTREVYLQ